MAARRSERETGPETVELKDSLMQFWRRWAFFLSGLLLPPEGFPTCNGLWSHWNGFPPLLREEDAWVDARESWQLGPVEDSGASFRVVDLLRSVGDPKSST